MTPTPTVVDLDKRISFLSGQMHVVLVMNVLSLVIALVRSH